MKMWKLNWRKLTHKQKAHLYLLGALLIFPLLYCILGFPSLTAEMAFRRAEKAAMVGPSRILATEKYEQFHEKYQDHPRNTEHRLIIGQTDSGYILFPYTSDLPLDWNFSIDYREKMDDITLMADTLWGYDLDNSHYLLNIYAFHDYPKATRGELEITHEIGLEDGSVYQDSFHATAMRDNAGFFRFEIYSLFVGAERDLLKSIANTLCQNPSASRQPVKAVIRLYDNAGELVIEKNMEILPYDTYGGNTDEN